jgi:hypothetical protein
VIVRQQVRRGAFLKNREERLVTPNRTFGDHQIR